MKKFIINLIIFLSMTSFAQAENIDCFMVRENNQYLINEGKSCNVRYSPASTFKVPLAVIGYESGILKDRHSPIWNPIKPVTYLKDYHDGPQTPSSWMRFSVVWYSQMLTQKLGMKKFQTYIDKLNYGNKDLSGNPAKNDGLTESWLSSSIQISPLEQINFIEKLAKNELPFSQESQMKTKDIMKLAEESLLSNGWSLYGKTGTDVDQITKERRGYFLGFGEKNGKIISFVIHISGNPDSKIGGIYSKKIALDRMMKKILNN